MTTYTAIPNADIDTDSPITQSLMTLLRDNPLGIQEGASGAPRIVRGAIANGVGHRWFFDYGDETDGAITHSASASISPGLYQCTTFQIDATYTVDLSAPGPLIICATTSITINGTIDVDGMGAQGQLSANGQSGFWGGSGGGGRSTDGGHTYLTDGGVGDNTDADPGAAQSAQVKALLLATTPLVMPFDPEQLNDTRAYGGYHLGGGGGGCYSGNTGGDGGGVVVLCAPTITIGAAGVITADGTNGGTQSGGGGGGVIVLAHGGTLTETGSVAASAGTGNSPGDNGGAGWVERIDLSAI